MSTSLAAISTFREQLKLEVCLEELAKYGEPRLSKCDKGWHCSIDVFVTGEGVEFKVRTDFRQKTPTDAANNCYALLMKALEKIKKGGEPA